MVDENLYEDTVAELEKAYAEINELKLERNLWKSAFEEHVEGYEAFFDREKQSLIVRPTDW